MAAFIAWFKYFISGFAIWKGEKVGKILFISVICLVVILCCWKFFLQRTIANQTFGRVDGNATSVTFNIKPVGCGGFWIRR